MPAFSIKKPKEANYVGLAEFGFHKIKRGMVVFTLGYSEEVIEILLRARREGIIFEVNILETIPGYAGRKTAQILARNKIHVNYFADSALRIAIKKADLVLLGCDAISKDGTVYATLGSELVSDMADKHDVPVYFCASFRKYKPDAEKYEKSRNMGSPNELWNVKNSKIKVLNYKYEKVGPRLITGIISEFGILKIFYFISEAKRAKP